MKTSFRALILALSAGLAPAALAQPQFIVIPNFCSDVNNGGTVVVGSAGDSTFRWVRSGGVATVSYIPQSFGGRPHCSADGSVVVADGLNGENAANGLLPDFIVAGHWTAATGNQTYGTFTTPTPGVGIGTPIPPGTLNTPFDVSDDGNIAVGLAYVTEGNGLNNFRAFRGDFAGRTLISLGQLGGEGSNALCVSGNGNVIGGWDRSPTTSIDRPAVWRFDPATGAVVEFVLAGDDDVGQIGAVNFDGSVIAGSSSVFPGQVVKWTWNGTSYVPTPLGALGEGGNIDVSGMTSDGNMIVGSSGSFFFGQDAFLWTPATGVVNMREYFGAQGMTGLGADDTFSAATSISPDGSAITVGGFFATSGVIIVNGGAPCVAPTAIAGPSTTEVSACEPTAYLNVSAAGTGPFTYQWRKNGVPIVYGPTGTGSTYAEGFFSPSQLIIQHAGAADAGTYDCVVSNACSSAVREPIMLTARPADPNDTCADALQVNGVGSVMMPMCGAYVNEQSPSCSTSETAADVWIRFTAVEAGDYRITTCGQPGYDTILTAYNTCGGPEIACSDNFCYSLASIERVTLAANQSLLIRLGVSFAPPDPVMVTFESLPPVPANDTCATAQVISESGFYPYDNTYALNDGSASCNSNSGKDVWFNYLSTTSGLLDVDTCGTVLDTVLTAYDGCGGMELGCSDYVEDNSPCLFQSKLVGLTVIAGRPMLIRVAANTPDGFGTGTLNVTFTPGPSCPPDFNGDGTLDPDDLADYIGAYFSQPPTAGSDYNQDGIVDPDDLADYIGAFFAGC